MIRTNAIAITSAVAIGVAAALWPGVLAAQSPEAPNAGVQVGDMWIYDRTDDITKAPMDTFTSMVTDVSPTEITTSAIFRGKSGRGIVVFDHDWDRTVDNDVRYTPNDGHGIRLPLAVGKEWRAEYTSKNLQNGVNTKNSGLSKVVAQETLTTPAGTFETYKIDRHVKNFNVADPSRLWDIQVLMWFSPQINHWVRRSFILKAENRVRSSSTDELTDFIQKK